jgi:hypothetical protein
MLTFSLIADYHQFYIFDDGVHPAYPESITYTDIETRLKSVPNLIAIYTQGDSGASVDFEYCENVPQIDGTPWAHIVEAPLNLASGRMVLASPSSHLPECPRVAVSPGSYRARVAFHHLVSGERERFQVSVWQCQPAPVAVIKSGGHHAA